MEDRPLPRSVKDFSGLLAELRRGRRFISTTESFDTSTPIGRAMVQITMVFAELERGHAIDGSPPGTAPGEGGRVAPGRPLWVPPRDQRGGPFVGPLLIDEDAADVVREPCVSSWRRTA